MFILGTWYLYLGVLRLCTGEVCGKRTRHHFHSNAEVTAHLVIFQRIDSLSTKRKSLHLSFKLWRYQEPNTNSPVLTFECNLYKLGEFKGDHRLRDLRCKSYVWCLNCLILTGEFSGCFSSSEHRKKCSQWRVRLQHTLPVCNLSTLRLRYQVPKMNTVSAE